MKLNGEISREVMRWTVSGIVVLGLHVGGAAAIANWPRDAAAGSPEAAIVLDLSAETAAPNTEKTDVAVDQVNQQQAEKEPEPEKPVEKELEPEKELPKQAEVELPKPPPPKPVVKPPPKKMAALNTRQLAADRDAPQAASNPGMMGRMKADYGVLVSAHLNRYKNVPRGLGGTGGTVNLAFTLDRQGHVLSSRIVHGSGMSELDSEALDMLRRAQPFPAPPADLAGSTFPFSVPVRYTVR